MYLHWYFVNYVRMSDKCHFIIMVLVFIVFPAIQVASQALIVSWVATHSSSHSWGLGWVEHSRFGNVLGFELLDPEFLIQQVRRKWFSYNYFYNLAIYLPLPSYFLRRVYTMRQKHATMRQNRTVIDNHDTWLSQESWTISTFLRQSHVAQISLFTQRDFVARRISHQFCRIV